MEVPTVNPATASEQRHQIVRDNIEVSEQALRIPQVVKRLGHYAGTLNHALQHLTIPALEADGHLTVHERRSNLTPIVALHIGEVALRRSPDLMLNRIQQRHLRRNNAPYLAQQFAQLHAGHIKTSVHSDDLPLFHSPEISAFVYSHCTQMSDQTDTTYFLRGRPVVALNIDTINPVSAPSLLHELTHVMQINRQPLLTAPSAGVTTVIKRELEAYHVSAQTIRGFYDAGELAALNEQLCPEEQLATIGIDNIRQRHQQGSSKFHVTDALVEEMLDHGYGIISGDLATEWNAREAQG